MIDRIDPMDGVGSTCFSGLLRVGAILVPKHAPPPFNGPVRLRKYHQCPSPTEVLSLIRHNLKVHQFTMASAVVKRLSKFTSCDVSPPVSVTQSRPFLTISRLATRSSSCAIHMEASSMASKPARRAESSAQR